MDARGHVHMMDVEPSTGSPRHTGFVTRDPMPEQCNARKVLAALDKLAARGDHAPLPSASDAALLPLTPFEKGYVLGVLAEYRARKAGE